MNLEQHGVPESSAALPAVVILVGDIVGPLEVEGDVITVQEQGLGMLQRLGTQSLGERLKVGKKCRN